MPFCKYGSRSSWSKPDKYKKQDQDYCDGQGIFVVKSKKPTPSHEKTSISADVMYSPIQVQKVFLGDARENDASFWPKNTKDPSLYQNPLVPADHPLTSFNLPKLSKGAIVHSSDLPLVPKLEEGEIVHSPDLPLVPTFNTKPST